MRVLLASLFVLILFAGSAESRPRHTAQTPQSGPFCWEPAPCGATLAPEARFATSRASSRAGGAILPHPAGCPGRAFCGCGASVRVFGHPVRSLYLAVNWIARFPRAAPAPGRAAARRGHVFVLEQHVSGDDWLVYDANSGGHATRRHVRSIRGYTVVDPRA